MHAQTQNELNLKKRHTDYWVFFVLIALANIQLLLGRVSSSLVFFPDALIAGQWWRLLTHPLVHVSWYHLLLDAAAFLVLYRSLAAERWGERVAYVACAGLGSLVVSLILEPGLPGGLCGLSGIAHGLMAVMGLEMLFSAGGTGSAPSSVRTSSRPARRRVLQSIVPSVSPTQAAGFMCFSLVIAKCIFELGMGGAFFSSIHFGSVGNPVVSCHAGGVIGALVCYGSCRLVRRVGWVSLADPVPACVV